jgi:signal transduction histidine kinase
VSILDAAGPTAVMLRERGMRSLVGAPIAVEGRVWGAVIAVWLSEVDDPLAASHQVGEFTELVGAAIANAHSRDELAASRARIVVAADDARRRIERDIHDGAQQRLISLGLELRLAEMSVSDDPTTAPQELRRLGDSLSEAVESLQEVARGVHPAILSHGGLTPALEGLARRSPIPATVRADGDRRLPESVEVAAYYFVSEALTNVAKHADASAVTIDVDIDDDQVLIVVRDDGVGGADPGAGSGLLGLRDRIEAVGGHIEIASRPHRGTVLSVTMPAGSPPTR